MYDKNEDGDNKDWPKYPAEKCVDETAIGQKWFFLIMPPVDMVQVDTLYHIWNGLFPYVEVDEPNNSSDPNQVHERSEHHLDALVFDQPVLSQLFEEKDHEHDSGGR